MRRSALSLLSLTLLAGACAHSASHAPTVRTRNPFYSGDTILRAATADGARYKLLVSDVNTCAEVAGASPARLVIASDRRWAEVALTPLDAHTSSGCVPRSLVTPATKRVTLRDGDTDVVIWELR